MNMTHNKLTCLFGHHDYSEEPVIDNHGRFVHLCKICKRSGRETWYDGEETWYDYDAEGNCVHERGLCGFEIWVDYDKEGNEIHTKDNEGEELWKDDDGFWVDEKPENWKI